METLPASPRPAPPCRAAQRRARPCRALPCQARPETAPHRLCDAAPTIASPRFFFVGLLRSRRVWGFSLHAHPEPPMPLALSTEELDLLLALARPLEQHQRDPFLTEVAAEIEAASAQTGVGPGLGVLHRVGRVVQLRYFSPPALPNASPRARA